MNIIADFGENSMTIGMITTLEELDFAFKRIKKNAIEEGLK